MTNKENEARTTASAFQDNVLSLKALFLFYRSLLKIVGFINWTLMLLPVLAVEYWVFAWLRPRMIEAALSSVGFYVMPIVIYAIPAIVIGLLYFVFVFEHFEKVQQKMTQLF